MSNLNIEEILYINTANLPKYAEKAGVEKIISRHMKLFIAILISVVAAVSLLTLMGSKEAPDLSYSDITVEFTTNTSEEHLVAGKEVLLTFRLKDNRTGKPISGMTPEVSFLLPGEHVEGKEHKHFGGYHLTGELNLAKLQLFILNSQRGTIEVLDTFGGYDPRPSAVKKLGTMTSKVIRIKGSKIGDLLAGRYGDHIYATLSLENQVAVVNSVTHEVAKYIDVGAAPGAMFLQPKSRYLWVSNANGVSILDTEINALTKTIETGKGSHRVAFSPGNAYVTNGEDSTVTVIRLSDLTKIKDIKVDSAYGIDYSSASNEVYVSNNLGEVMVIDAGTQQVKEIIPLGKGIEVVSFSPDGRLGIMLDMHGNTAYVVDAMNNSLIRSVKTGEAPATIVFMANYALIRNTYSPDITYINMNNTGISNNEPLGTEPALTWMPHSIVTTSYGDEAVVTSPRDGRIYFMHIMNGEPMAMSQATVEFGSDAVAIVENKLHETSPGTYQQYIILEREGTIVIEFKTQSINALFEMEVLPAQTFEPKTIALFNKTFKPGIPSTLQYLIIDGKTGKPLENLTDLVYVIIKPSATKGTMTKRLASRYRGNGTYEAVMIFPEEGEYMITLTGHMLQSKGYRTAYDYVSVRK